MDIDLKNITRYTYGDSSFLGWRVAFCRNGRHFTRYFPDRQYGSREESLQAAVEIRNAMRYLLQSQSSNTDVIFHLFEQMKAESRYSGKMNPPGRRKSGSGVPPRG